MSKSIMMDCAEIIVAIRSGPEAHVCSDLLASTKRSERAVRHKPFETCRRSIRFPVLPASMCLIRH